MRSLLMTFVLLALGACASFESGDLPNLDRWPPQALAAARPALRVEVNGLPKKFAGGWVQQAVKTCEASERFASVTTETSAAADRVARFDIEHSRPDGLPVARVWMGVTALTLGVIPARSYQRFVVHAHFLDANGHVLGTAERTVESQTWVGWVMLFALPFAGAGMGGLIDDTTRSILVEANDNGWL
ncbi:MAG: hypothetical protein H6835_09680 [Planctomycetes bacterium]|nr:hypothetical protein [Planctomycetota bacterium]